MQDRDELAKYICDRIETTPIRCGRSVERSIVDALADEYEFRARKDDKGDSHRDAALALPKAPYALPAST